MKKSNEKRRVKLFTLWAALILLAASLFTGCPQKPESKPTPTPESGYKVNFAVQGGNGTLEAKAKDPNWHPITTGTEIEKGKTVSFTAVPDPGYMTDAWTILGGSFEAGTGTPENPLAKVKVTATLTVRVSFKPAGSIPLEKLKIEGTVLKGYTGEKPSGILNVPGSITEIDQRAFLECTGITEVHLPESLTKIGMYAFKDCKGMRKLVLGKNLTHIGFGAFDSCENLEGKLEFPSDLAEIDASAFSGCFKLSALDFSECTKPLTIGNYAFQACEMTGTVQFPASLASLGEGAFWNCNNVECFDFYLCSSPPLTAIGSNAFYYTNGRFKVKTGTGIKELLTGSGVAAGKIDETP